jgi:serine phosphatase RsbU (regulator of sigma subunit)
VQIPRLDDLTQLPEERAVERWFDGRNWRTLRRVLVAAAAASVVAGVGLLSRDAAGAAAACGANLLLLAAMWLLRHQRWFAASFRSITLGLVLVEFAVFASLTPHEGRIALSLVVFPLLLVFLRLRPAEALLLAGTFGATGTITVLWDEPWRGALALLGPLVGLALPPVVALLVALHLTRRERRSFLERWRQHVTRERERVRMRDELADARRLQLAMLPDRAPAHEWLDLAATSLPASEVGGDFFDYLDLGEGRVAVVVGDVAGHGVAAGLVLAAVKSGLHLLRDDLTDPVAVFQRLDRMVRDAVRWRLFVTLLVAIVGRDDRRVRVVSAGHPPALLVGGDGARFLGHPALPLGTRLAARYRVDDADLGPGDLLVLYSDGLTEHGDAAGEGFGSARLQRGVLRLASGHQATARSVRDGVLDALSRFKGDSPQRDDVTLVVVRRTATATEAVASGLQQRPPDTGRDEPSHVEPRRNRS